MRDPFLDPPIRSARPNRLRIGMVSTYPPTVCGLATFAAALVNQFTLAGHTVDVICLDDGKNNATVGGQVVANHLNNTASAAHRTSFALQRCDVVVVQHEFGIFGGRDGDEVLALLDAIAAPVIVVAHTVPLQPSAHQREVLVEVCDRAARVVVMTATAHDRLVANYPVDPATIVTIPHGAAAPEPALPGVTMSRAPELLTWGLLGPGKGIEHVIDALALLVHDGLCPQYTVSGVTHPNVLAHAGDVYRHSLIARARDLGIAESVTFDATYRSVPDLTRFVASASAVVLPYDSRDQVTSGVLVDAIVAGRPVIATAFPHAVELLASGAGIVVPHGDVVALADAIRVMVDDREARAAMAAEAVRLAPQLLWSTVAASYLRLCDELERRPQPVAM